MTDGQIREELEFVDVSPPRVLYSAIAEPDGQCAVDHPGAASRCPNDATHWTSAPVHDDNCPVPLCADHADQEVNYGS